MANLTIGDPIIDFKLPGVDDSDHALQSYRDSKALAVIFTCNHCPYAQAWESRLIQTQADYADKDVQFLAISSNDATTHPADSFDAMKQRASEQGFNFPYLYDETQETAKAYGAERTPEIFLFDASGKLVYHGALDDNYEDPTAVNATYLRDALDAVLAGNTPPVASTPPVGCTIKWKA